MKKISKEDLKKLRHKEIVIFALFCAEQVSHLTNCVEAHKCIEAVKLFLEGKATREECLNAANAARAATYATYAADAATYATYAADAATYAADAAANAAANATYAAANAAYAAAANAKNQIIEAQWNFYNELLHLDNIFEKTLLEVKHV